MRYPELFKNACRGLTVSQKVILEFAYNRLNEHCDKFNKFIRDLSPIALIDLVIRQGLAECFKSIQEGKNDFSQALVIYLKSREEMSGILTEILRERTLVQGRVKINDPAKMLAAFKEFNAFVTHILIPLLTWEKSTLKYDQLHIWLEYDQNFHDEAELQKRMILLETMFSKREGERLLSAEFRDKLRDFKHVQYPDLLVRNTRSLGYRAPWVEFDLPERPSYAQENKELSTILIFFDVLYSNLFMAPFIEHSLNPRIEDVDSVYRNSFIDLFKIMFSNFDEFPEYKAKLEAHGEPEEVRKIMAERLNDRYYQEQVFKKSYLCPELNKLPLSVVKSEELTFALKSGLSLELLNKYMPKIALDMDNLDQVPLAQINCFHAPFLKFKENGEQKYIIIPWLLSCMEYEKTVYHQILKTETQGEATKLAEALSLKMEKLIIEQFSQLEGVRAINVPPFQIQDESLDFDGLIIEEETLVAFVIEYKHSMEFRRQDDERYKLLKTPFRKAISQLEKRLRALGSHSQILEKKFNLPPDLLKNLTYYPLIISNTLEFDRKVFKFKKPIPLNGKTYEYLPKISYFELNGLLLRNRDIPQPLLHIKNDIQNYAFGNEIQTFIDFSSLPKLSDKGRPVRYKYSGRSKFPPPKQFKIIENDN